MAAASQQPEAGGSEQHSLAYLCVIPDSSGDKLAFHGWGAVCEGWAGGGDGSPGGEVSELQEAKSSSDIPN